MIPVDQRGFRRVVGRLTQTGWDAATMLKQLAEHFYLNSPPNWCNEIRELWQANALLIILVGVLSNEKFYN